MHDAIMTRRAGPASVDRETRTARAVASTFADVPRGAPAPSGAMVPWTERLDPAGADLSRFVGAPLLTDHQNRTDNLAGIVEAAERGPKGLEVTIRFAQSARGEEAFGLVADGILSGVSIGYRVAEWRNDRTPRGERPVFTAARWAPLELSLVPVPADDGARIRAPDPKPEPKEPPHMDLSTRDDAAAQATQAERNRVAEIEEIAQGARSLIGDDADTIRARAIAEGVSPDVMRRELLERAVVQGNAMKAPAPRPVARMGFSGDDPAWKTGQRAAALASQMTGQAPPPSAAEFMAVRGFTGMARDILEEAGISTRNMSNAAVIETALLSRAMHTTSDFPALLKGTGDRMLIGLREAAMSPIGAVCRPRSVADFRPFSAISAAGPTVLEKLQEGGEVTHTTAFESSEVGALATYARNVAITRQALVNDDLQVFANAARFWASGIAETERRLFLAMFAVNPAGVGGFGPTMKDGEPLFSSAHFNVASGAPNTTGIGVARKTLREQKDLNGNLLAVGPAVLLTGPTSETPLEQAVSSITIATSEASRPIFSGLQIAVEAGISGAEYFAFASPSVAPVLEYATLAGRNGQPAIETFTGPERDGVTVRVIHDVAIVAVSWIGAVRLTGS